MWFLSETVNPFSSNLLYFHYLFRYGDFLLASLFSLVLIHYLLFEHDYQILLSLTLYWVLGILRQTKCMWVKIEQEQKGQHVPLDVEEVHQRGNIFYSYEEERRFHLFSFSLKSYLKIIDCPYIFFVANMTGQYSYVP